jgi:hypothetical protein
MAKLFKFEQKIPAMIVQYYEVEAETEEEALAMVSEGIGFQESFTDTEGDNENAASYDLYDVENIP